MNLVRVMFSDLNGALRGKYLSEDVLSKNGHASMPMSTLVADIEGGEIKSLPNFTITSGDKDMRLVPDMTTMSTLNAAPITAQVIADIYDIDGNLCMASPRQLLGHVMKSYRADDYTIKTSLELEAYLYTQSGTQLTSQQLEVPYGGVQGVYSLRQLFNDIIERSKLYNLSAESIMKEAGRGQIEMTFEPEDAMLMADGIQLVKQAFREIASDHDFAMTFMAKPFAGEAGNGGHVHLSLHKDDTNIFLDENVLEHFVAGQLKYLRRLSLLWFPNTNSYRRFTTDGYVADSVTYGEDTRDVAIRILGDGANRRIEHRIAGADANPYLVYSAVLASGIRGLQDKITYDDPTVAGEIGSKLARSMDEAIELFDHPDTRELLGDEFTSAFVGMKRQEWQKYQGLDIVSERELYAQQL